MRQIPNSLLSPTEYRDYHKDKYNTLGSHQKSDWDSYSTVNIYVLCANKTSFDTFLALGGYKKTEFEKFIFVDNQSFLDENSCLITNKIIILEDFYQNPNCREILDRINGSKILL